MAKLKLKKNDKHLVVSHAYRMMKAFTFKGEQLFKVDALTEGVNDDVDLPGGDTPMGLYKAGEIVVTSAMEPNETWYAYGKHFIDLVDLENQETGRGRGGLGIHGGGTGLAHPLEGYQPLLPTRGCIRAHNEDLRTKIVPLVQEAQQAGGTVYVTVTV